MKRLIILVIALFSLSSCAPVGVLSESAYYEQQMDPRTYSGSISYNVDPIELQMH
jgi:hypothetical protein